MKVALAGLVACLAVLSAQAGKSGSGKKQAWSFPAPGGKKQVRYVPVPQPCGRSCCDDCGGSSLDDLAGKIKVIMKSTVTDTQGAPQYFGFPGAEGVESIATEEFRSTAGAEGFANPLGGTRGIMGNAVLSELIRGASNIAGPFLSSAQGMAQGGMQAVQQQPVYRNFAPDLTWRPAAQAGPSSLQYVPVADASQYYSTKWAVPVAGASSHESANYVSQGFAPAF